MSIYNTPIDHLFPPMPEQYIGQRAPSIGQAVSVAQTVSERVEEFSHATVTVRPKTNAEWLESVAELVEQAEADIHARETNSRIIYLHSQMCQDRTFKGAADPAMVEEYAVLAGA